MKMMDNRAYQAKGIHDSDNSVRQAGGEDPRRAMFKPVMETKIRDHDQSGYNHAYTPEADRFARQAENKAMGMGTPHPDGTYSK